MQIKESEKMTCIRGKPLLKMFDSFNLAKKKNGKNRKVSETKKVRKKHARKREHD